MPLAELLAKADPTAGAASAKKCQSCHDFTQGGPNKTGPDLYNMVGAKIVYGAKPLVPFQATTPNADQAPKVDFGG